MTSCQLAAAIVFIEQSVYDRSGKGEAVQVGNIAKKIVTGIYFRQQCINVLRGRLKRRFDASIVGRIAKRDKEFAIVFCEKHLGRPFVAQSELALIC
jgi:hypothetical protein